MSGRNDEVVNTAIEILADKRVCYVTYVHMLRGLRTELSSPAKYFREFLLETAPPKSFYCVEQPTVGSDETRPYIESYGSSRRIIRKNFPLVIGSLKRTKSDVPLSPILKFRDFISTFYLLLQVRGTIDLYCGVESVNALVGWLFKKVGKVKRCVYYNMDYAEIRFQSKAYNFIFHLFDLFCVRHCDISWVMSPHVFSSREAMGLPNRFRSRQLAVRSPYPFKETGFHPESMGHSHSFAYVGSLNEWFGLQTLLESFSDVVSGDKLAVLHIVGAGKLRASLEEDCKTLQIANNVIFHGYVFDDDALSRILDECIAGLATYIRAHPYQEGGRGHWWYTDLGKPKVYASHGLPIIITDTAGPAEDIERYQAGLVVSFERAELKKAMLFMLAQPDQRSKMAQNALRYAGDCTPDRVYSEAIVRTYNHDSVG